MKKLILLTSIVFFYTGNSSAQNDNTFWKGIMSESGYDVSVYANIDNTFYRVDEGIWTEINSMTDYRLINIVVDQNENIWAVYQNNLKLSTDGGLTWNDVSIPENELRVFKVYHNHIYVQSWGGIYRQHSDSLDSDWDLIYEDSLEDFMAMNDSTLFISEYSFNILVSTDAGENWEDTGWKDHDITSTPAVLNTDGSRIFVGTYWDELHFTDDGGDTWEKAAGLPEARGVEEIYVLGDKVFALSRDQIGTNGLFISDDNGENFSRLDTGLSHWAENWIDGLAYEDGILYLNAGHRGFFMSSDFGQNWTEINNGVDNIKPHNVYKIDTDDSGTIWALMSLPGTGPRISWGLLKSTDDGATWAEADTGLVDRYMTLENIAITPSGKAVVTGYDPGTMHVSEDDGETWEFKEITRPPETEDDEDLPERISTIHIIQAKNNDTLYAGSYWDGILKSTDSGDNWEFFDDGMPEQSGVRSIFIDSDTTYTVLANQQGYDGLYFQTGEEEWQKISSEIINKVLRADNVFYGFFRDSLKVSHDFGETWSKYQADPMFYNGSRINDITIADISVNADEQFAVLVATNQGIYKFNAEEEELEHISEIAANVLFWDDPDKRLIIGTEYGIYFSEIEMLETVSTEVANLPAGYSLNQNYPNPFNPTTTIRFGLPEASEVRLEVYNILGQRVAVLVNEQKTAGWHNITFDASALSSGMYIYRVIAGEFVETRKLTLIK